jgi:RNA polymerase sigma-70 factor (ECF subfamily)
VSQLRALVDTATTRITIARDPMVSPLTFVGDDDALIDALKARHPGAVAVFYDRHAPHVHRVLRASLGSDSEIPDLLQEVFIRALDRIGELQDRERVRGWLTTVAVFVARAHIRRRVRRRWLRIFSPERTNLNHVEPPSSESRFALDEIYSVLDELPPNDRMAFVLRFIDGMTLSDAADACQVSLATFKRRLARAERQFLQAAKGRPRLAPWLKDGTRWNLRKQG